MQNRLTDSTHSVLSKDLLRPAGESMWGKRRPIGPNSLRAMIKQTTASNGNVDADGAAALGGRQYHILQPNMVVTIEVSLL